MKEMRGNNDVKVAVYKVECCQKQSMCFKMALIVLYMYPIILIIQIFLYYACIKINCFLNSLCVLLTNCIIGKIL